MVVLIVVVVEAVEVVEGADAAVVVVDTSDCDVQPTSRVVSSSRARKTYVDRDLVCSGVDLTCLGYRDKPLAILHPGAHA